MISALPLRRAIGPSGFFAIAFGSIVGSGWVIVLGKWLSAAGPGGSIIGFAAGGCAMTLVALCYGELASRLPRAGGEFIYALRFLGPGFAFGLAWFLVLFFAALTAFEGIALGWILGVLLPQIRGAAIYSILGAQVTLDTLLIGLVFAAVFAVLNYLGTTISIRFQRLVTFGFIGLSCVLVTVALTLGNSANARPLFPVGNGYHWELGMLWIFSSTAMFLNGFQSPAYAIEERTSNTRVVAVIAAMILGIVAAVIFYCSMIYAVSIATPWHNTVFAELPAAFAFGKLTPSGSLGTVILVGAGISLLKSWNAYLLCGARLIFALAREGYLPGAFSAASARFGSPVAAILTMFLLNALGIFCGRGAIVPIVDMSAICTTCSFAICLAALLKARKLEINPGAFQVPGGRITIYLALASSLIMAAAAVYEPVARTRSQIPVEWLLLISWSLLGLATWFKFRSIIRTSRPRTGMCP